MEEVANRSFLNTTGLGLGKEPKTYIECLSTLNPNKCQITLKRKNLISVHLYKFHCELPVDVPYLVIFTDVNCQVYDENGK